MEQWLLQCHVVHLPFIEGQEIRTKVTNGVAEPWRKILRTCGRAAQLSVWVVMSVPLVLSSLPQCQDQEGKTAQR